MVQVMSDIKLLKSLAKQNPRNPPRNQLSRFDWLQAALELFVREGIDAVRITRLADELDVSRGSFYWHFRHREDLITALVEFWQSKNSPGITRSFEAADSLTKGILNFFETCINLELFDPRLDLAIREWARRSDDIRQLLDYEDNLRIEAICHFFLTMDYPMPDALIRARVLYFSQIGFYALGVNESLSTRLSFTESYFECYTGQQLANPDAQQFRNHIQSTYGKLFT